MCFRFGMPARCACCGRRCRRLPRNALVVLHRSSHCCLIPTESAVCAKRLIVCTSFVLLAHCKCNASAVVDGRTVCIGAILAHAPTSNGFFLGPHVFDFVALVSLHRRLRCSCDKHLGFARFVPQLWGNLSVLSRYGGVDGQRCVR